MNIFMQHWYWNKYPTLFNFFFLNLKWLKPLSIFFLKYALYIFNEQIISKLHCSRIKYHRCIMNNWNNVKGQKIPTILSVYNHENKWKGNNLLMCFLRKQVFIKHYLRVTKSWIILLHWYSTCFIRTKLTIKKPITKSIHICVTKTVCRICQSYLVWIITL